MGVRGGVYTILSVLSASAISLPRKNLSGMRSGPCEKPRRHRWILGIADILRDFNIYIFMCAYTYLFRLAAIPSRIAAAIMRRSHQIETNGQSPRESIAVDLWPQAPTTPARFSEELPSRRSGIFSTVVARGPQSQHLPGTRIQIACLFV